MESWNLTWSKLIEINPVSSLLLPTFGGVYRLSYRSGDGKIYVFYVGQAEDLNKRINEHLSGNETSPCIKKRLSSYTCYVRYARVNKDRIRDGAERFLYRYYNPPCNLVEPSGPDIKINVE